MPHRRVAPFETLSVVTLTACLWSCAAPTSATSDGGARRDSATPTADLSTDTPARDVPVPSQDANLSRGPRARSSSIAVSPDGTTLYVANADLDSVSVIDTNARRLTREILLADRPPAVDETTGHYVTHVGPRSLALDEAGRMLVVTGQRAGDVTALDARGGTVAFRVLVGSEPVGVVLSRDGASAWVAVSMDAEVVRVDMARRAVAERVRTPPAPWSLALSADGARLYVTHLNGPGVSVIDTDARRLEATWTVPAVPPRGDARLANGEPRALYAAAPRPGTDELWVAHSLHAAQTAQPVLNFETTLFPALTVLDRGGARVAWLSTDAQNVPGTDGQFGDVLSGPRALEFSPDGATAFMLDAYSEDLVAIDAARRVQSRLLRPVPGRMLEGMALSPDGLSLYLDARNTSSVVFVRVRYGPGAPEMSVDGESVPRTTRDPMPARQRVGQRLFTSANSDALPITQNHWIACASCHVEGRSDGHVWRFAQGPRDTSSSAGSMAGTGFLNHTATRARVRDFWRVINRVQGGRFSPDDPEQAAMLLALEDYVEHAIPPPTTPRTDPARVTRGEAVFHRPEVGCTRCHDGPAFTDSGRDNAALDLAGPVTLHDVGTCARGTPPDLAHTDDENHAREPCLFDTPTLRGVHATAPYLHDGSAATLRDVLTTRNASDRHGRTSALTPDEVVDLVEFLRSL